MRGVGNNYDDKVCEVLSNHCFIYDPISILSGFWEGEDSLHVVATFCFRLLKELKTHLTSAHEVDLSHVAGNDLFKGFQVNK